MNTARTRRYKIAGIQITSLVAFLVFWQGSVASRILNPVLFPTPVTIVQNFYIVLRSPGVANTIIQGLLITLLAFSASLAFGLVAGLWLGGSEFRKGVSGAYLVLFNATPKMAFLPVFALAFGLGFSYQFWFGFIIAAIPMALNTMIAVASVPVSLRTTARIMGATSTKIYAKVVIPYLTPTLLGSARIIFGTVFGGILIAEEFSGTTGFGYLVVKDTSFFAIVPLYVTIVTASLVGIGSYLTLLAIERHFTRWTRARMQQT